MKKKFGQILVEQGMITEAQLEVALAEQQRTGSKLGGVLIGLGFVDEATLSQALALQTGVQQVDLGQDRSTPEALALDPSVPVQRGRWPDSRHDLRADHHPCGA